MPIDGYLEVKPKKDKIRTLTRKDIEDKMEEKLAGKKLTLKLIVDSYFHSMRELLMTADPVMRMEIKDFGVFEVKKTKPKPKARNIGKGEFVYVPGRRKMHFKPGRLLKKFLKSETYE